jgi:hypothetical protein
VLCGTESGKWFSGHEAGGASGIVNLKRVFATARRKMASTVAYAIYGLAPSPGRLIQIGLTVYLLPALLVMLAVGVFGILALSAGELFCRSLKRELSVVREQVGQEIFRS